MWLLELGIKVGIWYASVQRPVPLKRSGLGIDSFVAVLTELISVLVAP